MAEPIRVAQMMTDMNYGGVEMVVMNYYRHIDRTKVQFDFFALEGSAVPQREEIEQLGGRVYIVPKYTHLPEYEKEIIRLFKQNQYKIVHSHMNTLSVFSLWGAKKAGIPNRIAHNHSTAGKGETKKNIIKYPDKFKIRKFGVSDVIAITAAGKTAFYYVDKEALVKFNGFLAPKAEGSYLILNEDGYQIEGQTDTWKVIDEKNVQEQRFVQLVCEQTKKQKPDIVLHDSGVLVAQTIYGFDSSVMKKIEKFLREQKPELLHHQKFLENGTAERAKESGTEQNYNMIDGCVNNNPKKPRIIGNRISVLDRLHIKLEERKQKSQPQQQQQQERSRKN